MRITPDTDDERCTATNRAGERCKNRRMVGLKVCRTHGGNSPQSKAKNLQAKLERSMPARFGQHVDLSPPAALLQELARSVGMVVWAEESLRGLTSDFSGLSVDASVFSSDYVPTSEVVGLGPSLMVRETKRRRIFAGGAEWELEEETFKENPLLVAYRNERKHLLDVANVCVARGLQQKLVDAHVQMVRAQLTEVVTLLRSVVEDPRLESAREVLKQVIVERIQAHEQNQIER